VIDIGLGLALAHSPVLTSPQDATPTAATRFTLPGSSPFPSHSDQPLREYPSAIGRFKSKDLTLNETSPNHSFQLRSKRRGRCSMRIRLRPLGRMLALAVTVGVYFGGSLGCDSEHAALVSKCKTIKLGDKEEKVIDTMGRPTHMTMIKEGGGRNLEFCTTQPRL